MANPVQQVIALAKKGDRRVLLGGAAIIGGGVGLIVFMANRNRPAGAGLFGAMPAVGDVGSGGGGGGGGGLSEIGGLLDNPAPEIALPELGEVMPAVFADPLTDTMAGSILPSNLAGTDPISFPELPDLMSAPYVGGFPELNQPQSYMGGVYGNDIGGLPDLPSVSGAVANLFQPTPTAAPFTSPAKPQPVQQSAGLLDAPAVHTRALDTRRAGLSGGRLSPVETVQLALGAAPPTQQISRSDQSGLQRLADTIAARQPAQQPTRQISQADIAGLNRIASNLRAYQPSVRAPGGGEYLRSPGESASAYIARATAYVQQLAQRQQQIPTQVVRDLAGTATRQISASDAAGLSRMAANLSYSPAQQAIRPISASDAAGLSRLAAGLPAKPAENLTVKTTSRLDQLR